MIKEIVMDFDGTIALTLDTSIKVLNRLSEKHGFRKANENDITIFRSEGWKKALKGFNISILRVPLILIEGQKEIAKEMGEIKMVNGLKEVLLELKSKKFTLGILTSNSKKNVEKFFEKHDLKMFDYIYSDKSLFGKERVMRKLLKERRLDKSEILYVGDETRDWEACQKAGVKMVGVSWGFNDEKLLKKVGVTSVVSTPNDLEKEIIAQIRA